MIEKEFRALLPLFTTCMAAMLLGRLVSARDMGFAVSLAMPAPSVVGLRLLGGKTG